MNGKKKSSSWGPASKWYDKIVSEEGHYYHQHVIIPKLLKLLKLEKGSLLDLACGQGILSRKIPASCTYYGVDISKLMIESAEKHQKNPKHQFFVRDITKPLKLDKTDFSTATIILATQNLEDPQKAFKNAKKHLRKDGTLCLVLNHPCFRIPKYTHWGTDSKKNLQYRRIDQYLSPIKIPISLHPSKKEKSATVWAYHYSLSDISSFLTKSGFAITHMEEWCSNKSSYGKAAKMENFARKEFPLFLAILAKSL